MASGSSNVQQEEKEEKLTETQLQLQNFFPQQLKEIIEIKTVDSGSQLLPLARIKKIMKLDPDVKMISAEAPLLFAKATEIFIHELTLRAWIHTEDNKRRTLQRNDIATAISKYDQFDFLIDIVPRDELKQPKREEKPVKQEQFVYFVNQQQVQPSQSPTTQIASPNPQQTLATIPTIPTISPTAPMAIQLQTNGIQSSSQAHNLIQIPQGGNQIVVQQVMSPNGEISQIPIPLSAQQLNLIRAQMSQPIQFVQAPQQTIYQTGQNIAIPINVQHGQIFLNSGQFQQQIKDE